MDPIAGSKLVRYNMPLVSLLLLINLYFQPSVYNERIKPRYENPKPRQEIEKVKASPSFEREYNLKYLGGIGNVFNPADIDAAIVNEYDIIEYLVDDVSANPPLIQGVMGIDPRWGVSSFGIVITHFVDGLIRVGYVDEHTRADLSDVISLSNDGCI